MGYKNMFDRVLVSIMLAIAVVCSKPSLAEPKTYQQILINEPVSLLDLTVYRAQSDAEIFLDSQLKGSALVKGYEIQKLDWLHVWTERFHPPLRYGAIYADFEFNAGLFVFQLSADWQLVDSMFGIEGYDGKTVGRLQNTQKNIAYICSELVTKLRRGLHFTMQNHAGYATDATKKLTLKDFASVRRDTRYRVSLFLVSEGEDYPWMTCEATGNYSDSEITYKYEGAWQDLEAIEMEYRERIGME